jgi:hypothetical protein
MPNRSIGSLVIAIFLICLLGPGTAFATLKCQCNNGMTKQNVGADFGDEDAEESCNDTCSDFGGGRVWQLDQDREFIDNSNSPNRRPADNGSRRR